MELIRERVEALNGQLEGRLQDLATGIRALEQAAMKRPIQPGVTHVYNTRVRKALSAVGGFLSRITRGRPGTRVGTPPVRQNGNPVTTASNQDPTT